MLIFRDAVVDQATIEDYRNSLLTKYVGVASFTILVWDHIITFPDEVELIWKGTKGPLVYLFFLIRYLIPLSFIVNLWAYFSTSWTHLSCSHFVRFEGAMTMIGISIVAMMMFLRIRALYRRVLAVQAVVIAILLTFIGVNSWLLTRGIPVHHSSPFVESCTMIFDPRLPGPITSSTAWLPLLYDSVVVALTLFRTVRGIYTKSAGQILHVMLREGLLYYGVICAVTLTLTIMIESASPSVRNITAQLELCLTVTMMSRITLHLKRFAHRSTTIDSYDTHWNDPRRRLPVATTRPPAPPRRVFWSPRPEAPPRVVFPPGWCTSAPAPAVPTGESFALEPFSAATGLQLSSWLGTPVADDPVPPPVPVDPDVLRTPNTVGHEELAGRRGDA